MKKIMLTISFVALFLCMFAQNHRQHSPYRTQYLEIVRMDTAMYQKKTTVVGSTLSATTTIKMKKLYDIPDHLKNLDYYIIDDIVRNGKPYIVTEWSWFVFWDKVYTKDAVHQTYSTKAMLILLFTDISIIVLLLLAYIFQAKSIGKVVQSITSMQLKYFDEMFWTAFGAYLVGCSIVCCCVVLVMSLSAPGSVLNNWFGYLVYHAVIYAIVYAVITLLKKQKN